MPAVDPERPAHEWPLSDEGRASLPRLIERLTPLPPEVVVASPEPKARDTGKAIADAFGLRLEVHEGVREHHRETVRFVGREAWLQQISRFFSEPDALVLGSETANQAHARFRAAIDDILERHAERDVAVATHGTVMSLFLSRITGEDPYAIGLRLGFPALVVLERPALSLVELVPQT